MRNFRGNRRHTGPERNAAWVRAPLAPSPGRKLRVVVYARYSTDEQNPRSIEDQVRACRDALATLVDMDAVEVTVEWDAGMSGELRSRPAIDRVRNGIAENRWDVLIAEDSSRLYRNETFCFDFVHEAIDGDVRVLCLHDLVDTAEDDWDVRLHDAQRQHAHANRYTVLRQQRAVDGLWHSDAAVTGLRPGYRREPMSPEAGRRGRGGPFVDEVDPAWSAVVKEAFERVAAGESTRSVAQWLTVQKLPKAKNAQRDDWTAVNVISMVRNPIYRGVELRGKTTQRKTHRTGRSRQVRNDPENIRQRAMPHLRVVSDDLWFLANDAIDRANRGAPQRRGRDNPLYGVPRGSRFPLSRVFACAICGSKMTVIGPNGYRCGSTTKRSRHVCWNRATAIVDNAHRAIRDAVLDVLRRLGRMPAEEWRSAVAGLLDASGEVEKSRRDRQIALQAEIEKMEGRLERLCDIDEHVSIESQTLGQQITAVEAGLARAKAELEELTRTSQDREVDAREILSRIEKETERIERMGRDAGEVLHAFLGRIEAVPCQQFNSNKVVLRARFTVHPIAMLPARLRLDLERRFGDDLAGHLPDWLRPVDFCVDLFEPSTGPKHGLEAERLDREEGLGLTEVGLRLGYDKQIAKRRANIAVQYGRRMRAAGVTDPFTELTERPDSGSRWRFDAPDDRSACDDDRSGAPNAIRRLPAAGRCPRGDEDASPSSETSRHADGDSPSRPRQTDRSDDAPSAI